MARVPLRLGLDTATPYLSLALADEDGTVVARGAESVGRGHAALLVPHLQRLCRQAGVTPDAIAAVTVGIGPGSYAGVRVGIAAARGIAVARSLPLAGASTLVMMAMGALADGETGIAVLDARQDRRYGAVVRREGPRAVLLAEPVKRTVDAWRAQWPQARWLEGVAPDAAWAAVQPRGAAPAEALYL